MIMTEPSFPVVNNPGSNTSEPSKPIKFVDIKKILKGAGRRPTDEQLTGIEVLIDAAPNKQQLIFQIISERELSSAPNAGLEMLKTRLLPRIEQAFTVSPPPAEDREHIFNWLRNELLSALNTPQHSERIRACLLWILRQYRNPDAFVQCCIVATNCLNNQRSTKKSRDSGFIFQNLAKKLAVVGGGKQPRTQVLLDQIDQIAAMHAHAEQKLTAAEEALKKLACTEESLFRFKETNAVLESRIKELEANKTELEDSNNKARSSADDWQTKHKHALEHGTSEAEQAKKGIRSQLRLQIEPKLSDALLYLNRATPAVDQVTRLLNEIQEILRRD